MPDSPLIDSLRRAVDESPSDVLLRLHLAEMLIDAGRGDEAVGHLASVLAIDPGSSGARGLMARALTPAPAPGPAPGPAAGTDAVSTPVHPAHPAGRAAAAAGHGDPGPVDPAAGDPGPGHRAAGHPGPRHPAAGDPADGEFDWRRAEADLGHLAPPMFLDGDDLPPPEAVDRPRPRLADVGGMDEVKARLDAGFLAPLRNPDLRRLYGKSLRCG